MVGILINIPVHSLKHDFETALQIWIHYFMCVSAVMYLTEATY